MRKSFILHKDSLGILSKLDDNQAGKLFKAIAEYCESGEINCDFQTELLLFPFQKQFDRDTESYQKTLERNRINGSKGGRPKTQDIPDKPSGLNGINNKPKKADSDSKSDSDSVSDNDSKSIKTPYQLIVDAYHEELKDLSRVVIISPKRKAAIKKLFNYHEDHKDINWWKEYFQQIKRSDFLMGRVQSNNHHTWTCDFDFIINMNNFIKIIEGKYL